MTKPTKPTKPVRLSAFNAIRHGAYSNLGFLPGEDPEEFLQFVSEVYEEYEPSGPTEEADVNELAKLLWRRERLGVYERAKAATKNRTPWSKDVGLAVLDKLITEGPSSQNWLE